MATLAIDAGTTLIKAVVFSETGEELGLTTRATTISTPHPAWSEQDMGHVWESVESACREAIEVAGCDITTVAVTAQGDGAWLIDNAGEPIRPAILWNDGRAVDQIHRFAEKGGLDKAWAINGSLTSLGLPNAIMMWLAEHEPETLRRARSVLTCGSWIFHQLTGILGQDLSEASAPWIDVQSGVFSDELMDLYGLSQYRHLIPDVLEQPSFAIRPEIAQSWGITSDVRVVMAPYDIVTTAIGSRCVNYGDAFAILGTTICPGIIAKAPQLDGSKTGLNLLGMSEKRMLRAFPTVTGANTLSWLSTVVGVNDVSNLLALAAQSEAGARGALWLPYLSESGERAPFFDPKASGVLFGLTQSHGREEIARALLESLSYVIREALENSGTTPMQVTVSGGGAQSDLWCQIIADVTGVPTLRTRDSQVGAKGAQIYAAVATGGYATLSDAVDALVTPGDSFTPRTEMHSLHSNRFELFTDLREQVSGLWHREQGPPHDA